MNKPNFSIAIIAKNEELTLPRLLASCKEFIDAGGDICMVDTGSTDNTINIAKSFGVRVFEESFNIIISEELKSKIDSLIGENDIKIGDTAFDFAKARNWIAEKTLNDLVFCPDCDEIIDWNIESINSLIEKGVDKISYKYTFSFDNKGKPLVQFNHSKFYNKKRIKWTRMVHEVIMPEVYSNKIEGWMTDEELNFLHQLSKRYNTIAEIGSWKGRSTNALLSGCPGIVTAIDHFKGSDPKDKTHGAVGVYEQFIENTKDFNNLKTLRMSSEEASNITDTFEMVFIDAEHTYDGVKKDIELWKNKATKILCGHDYTPGWPGVVKAVEETFGKVKYVGSIWYVLIGEEDISNVLPIKEAFIDSIHLKHYQNDKTRRSQYLKGLALDYILNGVNDRNLHYLARELYYVGKFEKAIELFKEHIKLSTWDTEKGQSYIYIGESYKMLGLTEEAKKNFSIGFSLDVNRREGLIGLASIYQDNKQWKEAIILYKACLNIPNSNFYGNNASNYGHHVHGQLSVCLYYINEKEESLKHLKIAIEMDPDNKLYKDNLKYYV